jgi:hypothetical protein
VWLRRLLVASLGAAVLAGCGGSAPSRPTSKYTYGPTPSVSARMICRPRAVADINYTLGISPVTAPTATWQNHRYTCTYRYRHATMTLWVQELPTLAQTISYMAGLKQTLGDAGAIANVGQGAFASSNGSAVSRKDNKVLVVEVSRLPARFGQPATSRADVAITVADVIFACWRGY